MLNTQRRREITMESMQRKKIGNNGLKKRWENFRAWNVSLVGHDFRASLHI
jgi:hypothetical protein